MSNFFKLIRVKHYLKNVLVLLPLLFSGEIGDWLKLRTGLLAFVAFSLSASMVYIINDLKDIEKDRLHPTKKNRPLAAGTIKPGFAYVTLVFLFLGAVLLSYFIWFLNPTINKWIWGFLALYVVINLLYSWGLKDIPILDLAILVGGFLIRVVYGALATDIVPSHWFYLAILAVCFFLALGKRHGELKTSTSGQTRKVLQFYNASFLEKNMYMCLGLAIAFYSLWSVDETTIAKLGTDAQIWTVPLVMLTMMRYSMRIEGDADGDPVELIFSDKLLLGLGFLTAAVLVGIIYL